MRRYRERPTIIGGTIDLSDTGWEAALIGDGTKDYDLTPQEAKMVLRLTQEARIDRGTARREIRTIIDSALHLLGDRLNSGEDLSEQSAYELGQELAKELRSQLKDKETDEPAEDK
jgi:hypothetical protein